MRHLPWILAIATSTAAIAQQYRVQSYTARRGAPCTQAYDAVQGPDGRMWFATRLGTTDYDGARWGITEDDPTPQRHLAVDDDGGIWAVAGYAPLRLSYYDGTRWTHHTTTEISVDPFPTSLAAADAGRAFIGTRGNGVVVFDDGAWRTLKGAEYVSALARLDGDLLVATPRGLLRYDEDDLARPPVRVEGAPSRVLDMERGYGKVWLVGADWVARYSERELQLLELEVEVDFRTTTSQCRVTPDGRGGALVAEGSKIHHIHGDGRVTDLDVATKLPFRGSLGMALDREHNIWLTSERGICKLTRSDVRSFTADSGMFASEATALCRRTDGTMLVGHNGGLTLFDGELRRTIPIDAPPDRSRVMDLEAGDDGEVWLAASHHGLGRLDAEDRLQFWRPSPRAEVHSLTRVGSTIWICGSFGVLRFTDGQFVRAPGDPEQLRWPARRISVAPAGDLWIATAGHGVLRLSRDGALRHWNSDDGIARSTYGVAHLADGRTLVASSAGLLQTSGDGLEPAPEAPADRPIFFVQGGERADELWLGTSDGVVFQRSNGVRRISASDGLIGHETNRAAALLSGNGRLWVGTEGGLNLIPGAQFPIRSARPTLELLAIEHDGVEVPVEGDSWCVPSDPGETSLRFRAISFFDEEAIRYHYKLEGLHDAWVGPTELPGHQLSFASLSPGIYRLRMFIEGADNQRSEELISRPIRIAAPITQRWWFLALAVAATLAVGAAGFRELSQQRYARQLRDAVKRRTVQLATAKRELARDSEQLQLTLDSIADAVVATDLDGAVILYNDAAAGMLGIKESAALGNALRDLLPSQCELPAEGPFAWKSAQLGGSTRRIEGTVAPTGIGAVVAFRDVTDRDLLEQEVAHRQRLESIGQLAGGIAHDFNNYLTIINGTLDMLVDEAVLTPDQRTQTDVARTTLKRAVSLTQQLLTFSSGGAPVRSAVPLRPLLTDAVAFALSGSQVEASVEVPADLPCAHVDEGQLAQAVHNLLLNARQALEGAGHVHLRARVADARPESPAEQTWLELLVSDDGPGMSDDIRDRAFDPFVSGRAGGTGLGLSVVHSIVQRHGGSVTVTSEQGRGTTFRLLLPGIVANSSPRPVDAPKCTTHARVLVMDDDDNVRNLLVRMAKRLGHECVATSHGAAAVEEYSKAISDAKPFDIVLLDLTVVGGMGGRETAGHLLELDAGARMVAVSGYSDEGTLGAFAEAGFRAALAKPFDREGLAAVIERVVQAD